MNIFSFQQFFNGIIDFVNRLMIICFNGVDDAVIQMFLEDELGDLVDFTFDGGQLHKHIRAVFRSFNHPLDGFKMADRS